MAMRHKVLQLLEFDGQNSLVAQKRRHVHLQVAFHCFLLLKFKSVRKVHRSFQIFYELFYTGHLTQGIRILDHFSHVNEVSVS
jgi:hypothetical protein